MAQEAMYDGRVVVGYDGSPKADLAVSWAAAEATLRGRGLTIVHAILPTVAAGSLGAGLAPSPELIGQLETNAHDQLEALARTLHPLDVSTSVTIGGPSGVLLEASETADVVVVGSRGRGGFASLILGSVAAQVAAHAACPVVTIRKAPSADAREIVVGIDATPGSEAALAFAFDEASRHGWTLIAVHAWDIPAYDLLVVPNGPVPVGLADVADEEVRMSAEVLAGFRDSYPDVEVQEHLVKGPPVSSILTASISPAMIVVGTRGHGPTVGALLGSISNGVLHKATVPVAVVPRPTAMPDAA
jgi:nucleotide-binding universal stress UspA family protein